MTSPTKSSGNGALNAPALTGPADSESSPSNDGCPDLRFDWSVLPAVSAGLPGTGGVIRSCVDDFVVTEIPAFYPSGQGDFAYALIEKRGLTTHDLSVMLRDRGVAFNDIGVAGRKDKHAVTRQWLSVPEESASALESLDDVDGLRVLETSRHDRALVAGRLRGNRFQITVRRPEPGWASSAEAIVTRLESAGLPNYFGPQRFGRFNSNVIDAMRLLRGERVPGGRNLHRFFLSALQSHLFNWTLKLRIERGMHDRIVQGDRAKKHDTGGMFVVEDARVEVESDRARRLEISAVLPLYGRKVRGNGGEAGAVEQEVLDHFGLTRGDFRSVARGDWRISRVRPEGLSLTPAADGYTVDVTLPAGAYATSLLREILKTGVDAAGIE